MLRSGARWRDLPEQYPSPSTCWRRLVEWEDAGLFFRLVSYRYLRRSTAITANKSVKDWPGIFAGNEALATAILDRLLHKSVALNIRGRSYRLQDFDKLSK